MKRISSTPAEQCSMSEANASEVIVGEDLKINVHKDQFRQQQK